MKVIDLLNKIANGEEVPKKIKYKGLIYYQDGRGYFHDETEYTTERAFLEGVRTDMVLNDEIEIIEEDKKIEKLNKHHFHKKQRQLANKINELIEEIEKLKGKSE